jgi:hypothetical protein
MQHVVDLTGGFGVQARDLQAISDRQLGILTAELVWLWTITDDLGASR